MPFKNPKHLRILSIDIGGSYVKATILDSEGKLLQKYTKLPTPQPASPQNLLKTIQQLAGGLGSYDCISAGFPGYVKNGVIGTAPNLDTTLWAGTDFRKILSTTFGKPTQLVNDADMQGLGVVKGKGLEMVITLGTGFGSALLLDGQLLPHLEMAHHPITRNKDYDQYIGEEEMNRIGVEKWNERMKKVLKILKTVFNYDTLYIGGGNVTELNIPMDKNIKIINNKIGIKGGARLWVSVSPDKPSPK